MSLLLLFGQPGVVTPPVPEVEPEIVVGTPSLLLEIDYSDPTGTFVGTEETAYVRSWSFTRGRSTGLDQQQAGRATVVLDNRTGRFDPANRSSDLWPNVLPYRRLRISAQLPHDADPYTVRLSANRDGSTQRAGTFAIVLFTGFITSWDQDWDRSDNDATVTVEATDAFLKLNQLDFQYGYLYNFVTSDFSCGAGNDVVPDNPAVGNDQIPNDLVGARMQIVLDCIDWPEEDRRIDPGTITVLGSDDFTNFKVSSNALTYLLQLAETEGGGWLFIDPEGKIRFIDQTNLPHADPYDVYGEEDLEQPYTDISAPFDDSQLYNEITVTTTHSSNTGEITKEDPSSVERFDVTLARTVTTAPITGSEMNHRAADQLLRYRYPRLRFPALGLRPKTIVGWRRVLRHEIGDLVRVRRRPRAADEITRDSRIEGVSIASPNHLDWKVTWQVSAPLENRLAWEQTSPQAVYPVFPGWVQGINVSLAIVTNPNLLYKALKMTAVAAGDMRANSNPVSYAVEPGERYEATAYFRPGATVRSVYVLLQWYDGGGSGTAVTTGTPVTEVSGEWVFVTADGLAPSSAVYVNVGLVVQSAAAAEIHYADFITLARI